MSSRARPPWLAVSLLTLFAVLAGVGFLAPGVVGLRTYAHMTRGNRRVPGEVVRVLTPRRYAYAYVVHGRRFVNESRAPRLIPAWVQPGTPVEVIYALDQPAVAMVTRSSGRPDWEAMKTASWRSIAVGGLSVSVLAAIALLLVTRYVRMRSLRFEGAVREVDTG